MAEAYEKKKLTKILYESPDYISNRISEYPPFRWLVKGGTQAHHRKKLNRITYTDTITLLPDSVDALIDSDIGTGLYFTSGIVARAANQALEAILLKQLHSLDETKEMLVKEVAGGHVDVVVIPAYEISNHGKKIRNNNIQYGSAWCPTGVDGFYGLFDVVYHKKVKVSLTDLTIKRSTVYVSYHFDVGLEFKAYRIIEKRKRRKTNGSKVRKRQSRSR